MALVKARRCELLCGLLWSLCLWFRERERAAPTSITLTSARDVVYHPLEFTVGAVLHDIFLLRLLYLPVPGTLLLYRQNTAAGMYDTNTT